MKVVEIFASIDGEGKRTGQLATFIRLAGCNLRCCYCDTTYSFDCNDAMDMSIDEIISICEKLGFHNITLTGGEPLIHKNVKELIKKLCDNGYNVNIETNGSIDLKDFIDLRLKNNYDLFFTVDYKTKYSLMNNKMNINSFKYLDIKKDIVKCVVSDIDDMNESLHYLDSIGKFNIWFSPVFGTINPSEIVDYVKNNHREDVTIQVQLHKIIWEPNKKGV